MTEAIDFYKQYAQMTPVDRQEELIRLIGSFPTFHFGMLAEKITEAKSEEDKDRAITEFGQFNERRTISLTEYRDLVFGRLNVLFTFAHTTPTFNAVMAEDLERQFNRGLPRPEVSWQQAMATPIEEGAPRKWTVKDDLESLYLLSVPHPLRRFLGNVTRVGPVNYLVYRMVATEDLLDILQDKKVKNSEGAFGKRAFALERRAYQSVVMTDASLWVYSTQGGLSQAIRATQFKFHQLTGSLEPIAQRHSADPDKYSRWREQFYAKHRSKMR